MGIFLRLDNQVSMSGLVTISRLLPWRILLLCLMTLLPCEQGRLWAAPSNSSLPTAADIKQRVQKLEADKKLNPSLRDAALNAYRHALAQLDNAADLQRQLQTDIQTKSAASMELRKIRRELERLQAQAGVPPSIDLNPANLPQALAAAEQEQATLKTQLAELEEQVHTLQDAPVSLQQRLAAARMAREEALTQLQLLAATGSERDVVQSAAKRAELGAEVQMRGVEIQLLQQQLDSLDARTDLALARRDLAQEQSERLGRQIAMLNKALSTDRQQAAAQVEATANQLAERFKDEHPLVQKVAKENEDLTHRLSNVLAEIDKVSREKEQTRHQLQQVDDLYRTARVQLEIAGFGGSLGQVLHRQRRELPRMPQYESDARQRNERITEARLQQFQVTEEHRSLGDPEQRAQQALQQPLDPPVADEAIKQEIAAQLRRLYAERGSLLGKLDDAYGTYVAQLGELDSLQRQLIEQSQRYAKLLEENLFWIASTNRVDRAWFSDLRTSLMWLVNLSNWRQVWQGLSAGFANLPLLGIAGSLLVPLLILYRNRLRTYLRKLGGRIGNVRQDSLWLSIEGLIVSLMLTLPWPLLFGTYGWLLTHGPTHPAFSNAVGSALLAVAQTFLIIGGFREICIDEGMLDKHFGWRKRARHKLRHHLTWLLGITALSAFCISLTQHQTDDVYASSLGRLAFLIVSITLAAFLWRTLHPKEGSIAEILSVHQDSRLWLLRRIWHPMIAAIPLALGLLALEGYYFTALQLLGRLFQSGWLVVGAILIVQLLLRGLNINKRKLAFRKAVVKREADLAARETHEEKEDASTLAVPDAPELAVNLDVVDDQARQLLRIALIVTITAGLWWIWSDIAPALNILNQITLWQHTSGSGANAIVQQITVASVGLALLIGLLTFLAARNIPGILEITLLQRLSLDSGSRYAITSLSRYFIFTVGVIIAVNLLGLDWSKAQWLVAALGVGLGFGLQEIVANFVSGLIILFERPIRVGDVVTVGQVTGNVTRIRIRATTITNWDRKELIVPNKTFITDQLVNWTLSDQVLRVVLKVGIGYGSDVALAQRVLEEVIQDNPKILADPAPGVYFVQFGESSLDFELRVFVREIKDMAPLTHELHIAVERALREHGIEIPFPQRDLHLRGVEKIYLNQETAAGDSTNKPVPQFVLTSMPQMSQTEQKPNQATNS
jgi:potassium efflux system protein